MTRMLVDKCALRGKLAERVKVRAHCSCCPDDQDHFIMVSPPAPKVKIRKYCHRHRQRRKMTEY